MSITKELNNKVLSVEDKQKASLEILNHLGRYCEEHHIRYYLAYGTLLGAVRHKGFIPWDDDVDIMIPRRDYERLLSEYQDETKQFKLISCFSDKNYLLPYAKIYNGKTARLNRKGELDTRGIGVDLFPLDGIPEDLDYAEKIFQKQNDLFIKVINRFYSYSIMPADNVANIVKILIGKAGIATHFVNKTTRKISQNMFNEDFDKCTLVACVTGVHSKRFIPFKREWFNDMNLEFENENFNCPCGYDKVLKKIYDDYMVIPPETDRKSTHTEVFVWR